MRLNEAFEAQKPGLKFRQRKVVFGGGHCNKRIKIRTKATEDVKHEVIV